MGKDINFGLARGLGSFSYASSAFLMGYLVEWLEPSVIYIVFIVSSILFIINLLILPNSTIKNESTEKPANPFGLITLNCKMKLELRNWDKGACPFIPIRATAGPLFSIFL